MLLSPDPLFKDRSAISILRRSSSMGGRLSMQPRCMEKVNRARFAIRSFPQKRASAGVIEGSCKISRQFCLWPDI